MASVDEQECLRDGCTRAAYARGICHSCYSVALQLVTQKETTWEALIAAGKATEGKRKRRPDSVASWFLTGTKG